VKFKKLVVLMIALAILITMALVKKARENADLQAIKPDTSNPKPKPVK